MSKCGAVITGCVLLIARSASAHRIDEYLQATILSLETDRIHASMRLIPGVVVAPSVIASIDGNGDGLFSDKEEQAYAQRVLSDLSIKFDGKAAQPKLVSWSFPQPAQMREGLGEIHIDYTIEPAPGGADRVLILVNHHLSRTSVYLVNVLVPQSHNMRILTQKRNQEQSLYELRFQKLNTANAGWPARWHQTREWLTVIQFSNLFQLGIRHIAEGTDHLLFLLVLLIPAPLLVTGSHWNAPASVRQSLLRILGIVTAFTIGHSLTLTLAAFGAVSVPSRPVEVLIAVSIFVSAVHAFRPIFPGKEALIAGSFGLIHGLAFAATLGRLGLGRWERIAGIFAFNLGIETMQMLVVAAILPSLIVLSRTRAYPILRISGSAFAGAAAIGWIMERLFDMHTPVDWVVNSFAQHALLIALYLFLVSVVCRFLLTSPVQRRI